MRAVYFNEGTEVLPDAVISPMAVGCLTTISAGHYGERSGCSYGRDRGFGAGRYCDNPKPSDKSSTKAKPTHKVTTRFRFLQTGEYSISVEKAGFQKAEVASFTLSVDQVARIDVKLSVGQTTESVQVSASAMPGRGRCRGNGDRQPEVVELPLNGRSFVNSLLTPGVNPGTPGSITVRRLRGSLG